MSGTVSESFAFPQGHKPGVINKLTLAWTSASDGTATFTTSKINGTILRCATNPGSAAPTDDWDVTLTDEDGLDVLAGQGANRDTTNSEHFCPGLPLKDGTTTSVVPIVVNGPLALSVSGAGSAKTGTIVIYFR